MKLGWNAERARTEMQEVIGALADAGIGLYDYRLDKHLSADVISAALGTPIDASVARQRLQDFRAEQRGLRGDRGYEELQARVNRWLAAQPRLSKLLEIARAQENPVVLSGLFDHVHDNNLGRA